MSIDCSPQGWDITVYMHKLDRAYPNSVYSDIVLGLTDRCPGQYASDSVAFQKGFHECGTTEVVKWH